MILHIIFMLHFYAQLSSAVIYDFYTGKIASKELINYYKGKGNLDVCTIDVKPCCTSERRRVDGTCYNFNDPARGGFWSPPKRILPAEYNKGYEIRKSVTGEDLPHPRIIRKACLSEGKVSDGDFTQFMTTVAAAFFSDVGSIHDILMFLQYLTTCCSTSMNDYMCTPIILPKDDHLNKYYKISCLNLTRPLTHQYLGCTNDSVPSQIVEATAVYDMSQVYNAMNKGEKVVRSYKKGQLIMEEEDGKTWPPTGGTYCPLNKPDETRCFVNHPNFLMPITLFVIWFMRLHNYFATQLSIINPCWDEDTLFYTARDMNIAFYMHTFLHEFLVELQGYDNVVKAGIISKKHNKFRDIYDRTMSPRITMEFTIINRYFHTMLDTTAKEFYANGTFRRNINMFHNNFRPGYLAKDNGITYLTQGQFRQPCGKIDQVVDPVVANDGLPFQQKYVDITTSDLFKDRLFGLPPYYKYLKFCFGHKVTCFGDLVPFVGENRAKLLETLYKSVFDVDLTAGMWNEKPMKGGKIPPTLACLLNVNILNLLKADPYLYDRKDRPYAFTKEQLRQIRTATFAQLLCTVGDGVTKIQRHALHNINPRNPLVKCRYIPKINMKAWADPKCTKVRKGPHLSRSRKH